MDLLDIVPKRAELTLGGLPEKTLFLRPKTPADEIWANSTLGADAHAKINTLDPETVARLVFHQLETESQAIFKKQTVKIVNEDTGEELEETIGGWPLMLRCVHGHGDLVAMLRAFNRSVGLTEVHEKAMQKRIEDTQKKSLTGARSSMSSEPPTVIRGASSSTSSIDPFTRSTGESNASTPDATAT